MEFKKPMVIAEAGCNHMGSMEEAKALIDAAANICKADVIKFQKRCNRELLTPAQYDAPHPNPENAYGKTYGEHREFLELSVQQHAQLMQWCADVGIAYSSSVWDLTSAKEIAGLHPKLIKIPSACNNHKAMLQWLCENYEGEIHVSVGMTSRDEIRDMVGFFKDLGRAKDVVLYSCTSGYPVEAKDVCLLEICRLYDLFGEEVKTIGFSGHHLGTAIDIAAYTLGATYIERHFTRDRSNKGTDHAASLDIGGMEALVSQLREVQDSLHYKQEEILPVEQVQRDKLKYRQQ